VVPGSFRLGSWLVPDNGLGSPSAWPGHRNRTIGSNPWSLHSLVELEPTDIPQAQSEVAKCELTEGLFAHHVAASPSTVLGEIGCTAPPPGSKLVVGRSIHKYRVQIVVLRSCIVDPRSRLADSPTQLLISRARSTVRVGLEVSAKEARSCWGGWGRGGGLLLVLGSEARERLKKLRGSKGSQMDAAASDLQTKIDCLEAALNLLDEKLGFRTVSMIALDVGKLIDNKFAIPADRCLSITRRYISEMANDPNPALFVEGIWPQRSSHGHAEEDLEWDVAAPTISTLAAHYLNRGEEGVEELQDVMWDSLFCSNVLAMVSDIATPAVKD